MTPDTRTNGQLAGSLGELADDLADHGALAGALDTDRDRILATLRAAAARLAARRVVLTPNTAQAAAGALRSAADAADALAQTDPRDLELPADLARELVERSEGDGDAWREIARRVESAIERDREPDRM